MHTGASDIWANERRSPPNFYKIPVPVDLSEHLEAICSKLNEHGLIYTVCGQANIGKHESIDTAWSFLGFYLT